MSDLTVRPNGDVFYRCDYCGEHAYVEGDRIIPIAESLLDGECPIPPDEVLQRMEFNGHHTVLVHARSFARYLQPHRTGRDQCPGCLDRVLRASPEPTVVR